MWWTPQTPGEENCGGATFRTFCGISPAEPPKAQVIPVHVTSGLQKRQRPRQRPAAIHEVPGVLTPAFRIPMEQRGAGGLGVLDPSPLPHSLQANTPVLTRGG
jgi:hypothetical protein